MATETNSHSHAHTRTHTDTHTHTLSLLSRWNVHKPSWERPHKAALCGGSQWCGGRRHAHRRPPRSPRHRGKYRLYTHRIFLHNGMLNLSETANGDPKRQPIVAMGWRRHHREPRASSRMLMSVVHEVLQMMVLARTLLRCIDKLNLANVKRQAMVQKTCDHHSVDCWQGHVEITQKHIPICSCHPAPSMVLL